MATIYVQSWYQLWHYLLHYLLRLWISGYDNATVIYEREYPRTAEKALKKRIIIPVITQLQRRSTKQDLRLWLCNLSRGQFLCFTYHGKDIPQPNGQAIIEKKHPDSLWRVMSSLSTSLAHSVHFTSCFPQEDKCDTTSLRSIFNVHLRLGQMTRRRGHSWSWRSAPS